jgi:integrase
VVGGLNEGFLLTNFRFVAVAFPVLGALSVPEEDVMTVMRRGNGWSFAVWVRNGDGSRRQVWRGGFRTRWDASAAERRFLVDVEDGANASREPASPTVAQFLGDWLGQSAPTRRATTSDSYERCVRDHVLPHLGEVRLCELTPERIRTWQGLLLQKPRRFRDGPLSSTTVRYCHRLLRRALQDALRWELIDRNPCDAVMAPRAAETEMRVWTPDEVQRFLASVERDPLRAMWRLFLVTGMRRGEIAGLRWIDVDLVAGRLSVRHTRVLVYDRAQVSQPKTSRSRRVIALDPGTVDALTRHRQRQDDERMRLAEVWTESGYVFVREDGAPLDPDRISHLFGLAAAAAGLPKIRLHDLRHTAASLAMATGVHPKVVSERLGHASVAFTLDVYSHLVPGMQEEAATQIATLVDGPLRADGRPLDQSHTQ